MENERTALVTGANRGIGYECVRQLAQKGYRTILTSRKPQNGASALNRLSKFSDRLHYHQLDVGDDDSINHLKQVITKEFGRLDILINNAGINYDTWQTAKEADMRVVDDTLTVNLMGPWKMVQAFLPLMQKNGYGRIVNVSSGAGAIEGMGAGTPAYSISKAALNVLTIKLGAELRGSNILVNAVCPGWVRTDMGGSAAPRSVAEGAKGIIWAAELPANGPSGGLFRDGKAIPF
ncbi:MAG: SDR family oxidoreductase [Bacteroidota bacterium]